ncbi:hypothetical protein M1506_00295 [Patescibacteria group bacterium]|nr:hypothetical protein [Patescibacteria group bacterium]
MNETLQLCLELKSLGYQAEALKDVEGWNEAHKDIPDGYMWAETADGEWYPNPGRKALVAEIKKLLGDKFEEEFLKGRSEDVAYQDSHENLMRQWIKFKKAND